MGLSPNAQHYSLWTPNESVYRTFRQWKLTESLRLESELFQIAPELLAQLSNQKIDVVTWIPQDRHRSWERGFESARKVAEFFADAINQPLEPLLELEKKRVRSTTPKRAYQNQLERMLSPNPFRARTTDGVGALSTGKVLLVDDLMTTGGTLAQGIESLAEVGFDFSKVITASVLIRPRQIHSSQSRV
jgi:predicted amidophosphoribosyltransferase